MANRTVAVSLIANVGGYISGIARASAATQGLGNSADQASRRVQSNFGAMSKGAALLGGAMAVGLGLAVKSALDFEKAMRNVNSLLGLSQAEFVALNAEVLALADRMPMSAQTLAEGLYEIASSGFSGAEGLEILEQSAIAATAGITDTDTAARGITAVLNAYGRGAEDAADVSDVLFSTVNFGVISFEELSHELGDFVGTAAAAKVPIEDAGAAIATMTLAGISGAESATSLNRVLQSLIDPSEALAAELNNLGYESGAQALETDGLRVVMDKLRESTGGEITALLELFPEIRAARGALALMAAEGENYARVSAEMEDETRRNGATQRVFEEQMKATANQAALVGSSLEVVGIQIGTALLPVIGKLIEGFGIALTAGRSLASEIGERLAPFFEAAADVGADLWEILTEIGEVVGPLAGGLAAIGGLAIITALNVLGEALSAVTGFLAENEEIAFALAAILAVQLAGGIAAVTAAFWTLIGTPVVLFISNTLIPAFAGVATFLTGGFAAALATAGTALAKLGAAGALIGVVAGIGMAIKDVIDFANAGDDAREAVDRLRASFDELDTNSERFDATSAAIQEIRAEILSLESVVDDWEDSSFLSDPFRQFDADEVRDAREELEVYREELERLEARQERATETEEALAEQFGITAAEVRDLADAYGIDLAEATADGEFAVRQMVAGAQAAMEAASELQLTLRGVPSGADEAISALTGVTNTAGMTAEQIEGVIEQIEKWRKATAETLASFTEPFAVYQGLLQQKTDAERAQAEATAAATSDASDSWEDHVRDVEVSLDEYATAMEEQLAAQMEWRDNLVYIASVAGSDVAQILLDMGPEAAGLVEDMANLTHDEMLRMGDLFRQDAYFAGQGMVGELQAAWIVADTVMRQGAAATTQTVAAELQMGVDEVRAIAARYGIALAEGVNPLLGAMGQQLVAIAPGGWFGGGGWAEGGYTGDGGKYEPAGVVHKGEYVITKERTAQLGVQRLENLEKILPGYAAGGFVSAGSVPRPPSTAPYRMPISTAGDAAMRRAYDKTAAWLTENAEAVYGGTAGGGAISGGWGTIWQLVKSQIPQARINSTFRPGDPGYHGRNKAIDFGYGTGPGGAGSAGLASINRLLHDQVGSNLAELIYDGIGDDRPDLKNGRPLTYSAATRAQHRNHVHAANYDQGGVARGIGYLPKATIAPERVLDPRQTVAFEQWMSRETSGGGGASGGGVPIDYDRLAKAIASAERANVTVHTSDNPAAYIRAQEAYEKQREALAPTW